jgi:protein CpxP
MFKTISPALRKGAAAATLSALLAGAPALAQTAPAPSTTAQPSAAAPAKTKAPRAKVSRTDRVEARIKQLHDELKITDAQTPQWTALAQIMRDNAQSMETQINARKASATTASAVDNLHSYEAIADAHADGLKKFVPAFEALYANLSDDQKKNADDLFRSHQGRSRKMHKKSS